jgi:hypothetical protein
MNKLLSLLFFIAFANDLMGVTFADIYRPLKLSYLYNLYDCHPEKRAFLDNLFKIKKVYQRQPVSKKKVLSYSLFFKPPFLHMNQPKINEKSIYQNNAAIKHYSSFNTIYLKPLINQLKTFRNHYPADWIARVYVAADLEFLVPKLLFPGVEIYVMNSNSLAAAPGSMWRFLVFGDNSVQIAYVKDADGGCGRWDGDFSRTDQVLKWIQSNNTRGFFRLRDLDYFVRLWSGEKKLYSQIYSPISAAAIGSKNVNWINIEKAMKGYILHRMLYPHEKRHFYDYSSKKYPFGYGNDFMGYGFDERFLKRVLYFAAADRQELTLLPYGDIPYHLPKKHLVRLDLEYTKYKTFKRTH